MGIFDIQGKSELLSNIIETAREVADLSGSSELVAAYNPEGLPELIVKNFPTSFGSVRIVNSKEVPLGRYYVFSRADWDAVNAKT